MFSSHFLKGKFGISRLYGLTVAVFLLFIIYLDVRPATTSSGPTSAQNFRALNCDSGCYAFGSHAMRVLIDGRGVMRVVFFDSKALTAFTAVPAVLALGLVDYVSAGVLASVYVTAVIQAKASTPKLQVPIKDIPLNTKCLIIGINDYVESYRMRWNHSCGYINYVQEGASIAEKNRIFAQAVERYGDLYDIMFLDRDAEVDTGMALSSVPKRSMAMGQILETPDTQDNKLQTRVLVSRLGDAPDFYEKIDVLKKWASQVSGSVSDNAFSNIFGASNPSALGKQCSGKYFNIGDCMRNRADSVLTIHWDAMIIYSAYVVGLYSIYTWMLLHKVSDPAGLYIQTAVGATCMFLGALLIGVIGAAPEKWAAWYSAGEGNLHIQNILLVAMVSRATWKACGVVFTRRNFLAVDELEKLEV